MVGLRCDRAVEGARPGDQAGPTPLLLVQSFVNTWDGDDGSDLLLDLTAARDWLTDPALLER